MYEQPKRSIVGRVIMLILSLLLLAGLIWFILWFFFWRVNKPVEPFSDADNNTSQSQTEKKNDDSDKTASSGSSDSDDEASSSAASSGESTSYTPNNSAPASSSEPSSLGRVAEELTAEERAARGLPAADSNTPEELANVGAGNVFTPIALITIGGVVYYQIKLRRGTADQI